MKSSPVAVSLFLDKFLLCSSDLIFIFPDFYKDITKFSSGPGAEGVR